MGDTVRIRLAVRDDCEAIAHLIQELANYEKLPNGPTLSVEDLRRDGFDNSYPMYRCLLAEDITTQKAIGFAFILSIYSSWIGKCMTLGDFYVSPDYRSKKVGSRLFRAVAETAYKEGFNRLEMYVLSWNPATAFYERHGAVNTTKEEDYLIYRLTREELAQLASQSVTTVTNF